MRFPGSRRALKYVRGFWMRPRVPLGCSDPWHPFTGPGALFCDLQILHIGGVVWAILQPIRIICGRGLRWSHWRAKCVRYLSLYYILLSAPAILKQDFPLFKCIFFPFCLFPLQIAHVCVAIPTFKIIHVGTYTRGWITPFHKSFLLICKGELDRALMPLPFNITWIYTRSFISPLIMAKISLLHEQPW